MTIRQNQVQLKFKAWEKYLEPHFEFGLDKDWSEIRTRMPSNVKEKGVYVIFTKPLSKENIIYIGKTRGPTMDFATRLYRHATKSASKDGKVYKELKKQRDSGKPVLVSLLDVDEVKSHYGSNTEGLSESAMIDILEQALIHYLTPRLQECQ